MRKQSIIAGAIAVSFFAGTMSRCDRQNRVQAGSETKSMRYICPMHPQFTSDHPGDTPCCGMRLVPDKRGASQTIPVTAGQREVMGVQTEVLKKGAVAGSLRLNGTVTSEETRIFPITTKGDGWVRNVVPLATGDFVRKGQVLAIIYGRDYQIAQQGLVYSYRALENALKVGGEENATPIRTNIAEARLNLQNMGFGEAQLKEIERTMNTQQQVNIESPVDGIIVARNVFPDQRFERSTELFRIVDLSRVWVEANVYERDAGQLRQGQEVRLAYRGKEWRGRVQNTAPRFDGESRVFKVRIESPNPDLALRPDMWVDVSVPVQVPADSLSVPSDAVIETGPKPIVFVESLSGQFQPRGVETGWRMGGRVEIRKGLSAGEKVVVQGNFLLDSESRLRGMTAADPDSTKDPICGMTVDPQTAKASGLEHAGEVFCSAVCKREFLSRKAS